MSTVTLVRTVSRDPDIEETMTVEVIAHSVDWLEFRTAAGIRRLALRSSFAETSHTAYTAWEVLDAG